MLLSLVLVAALIPQGPGTSTAPVVINEFSFDDAGGDDREFVELFNRTAAPVDLSNWTLQGEEGTAGGQPNGAFTFPPGTFINPGQYLVVGMALVPNVTFITTSSTPPEWMGENVAGSANLPDGMTLRDAAGVVIDGVVWNYAVWTAAVPPWVEGTGLFGAMQLIDGSLQPIEGQLTPQRWADGFDSNDNGRDFLQMIWTPGAPNASLNTLGPVVVESCDGGVLSTLNSSLAFSFTPATVFAPGAVEVAIGATKIFPPSPQGGNVARLQDPTGGGNMVTAQTVVLGDWMAECYVYVAPGNALLVTGEGESWAVGVRGTTDTFGHPHDVPGTYYAQASLCSTSRSPGATGVAWMAYVNATNTEVYLVDANNGGPGVTVLAGPIVCTTGVNDGWQRLRLRASGTSLVANFGGTFGVDNGQRFTATITQGFGTVYMQYRECIAANANMIGMLIDQLEIYSTIDTSVSFSGTPSPTNFGTPAISTSGGIPSVGNGAFAITASGLVPNGISILALDLGILLPGIPVPGMPPTVLVYSAPTFTPTVVNTAGGTGSFPAAIPPENSLIGTPLTGQYFDLDITLGTVLPFGSSRGVQILIGNS